MLYYNIRNDFQTQDDTDAYIHLNSCGWYEGADATVHTVRRDGRADYQLLYIKSGELRFENECYGAGTLYLFKPHAPQDYCVTAENTDYYWLHFTGKAFGAFLDPLQENAFDIGYCEPLIAFCREIVMQYADALQENAFYIQGRLLSTVAALLPQRNTKAPDAIDHAVTYINKHYTSKLSNDALAKLCGISKFHFIRRFAQKTGKTPQKYRTDLLLSKSATMLTDTSLKIAHIATALGFDDSLYFSRLFKKTYGISPAEYRKRH